MTNAGMMVPTKGRDGAPVPAMICLDKKGVWRVSLTAVTAVESRDDEVRFHGIPAIDRWFRIDALTDEALAAFGLNEKEG